MSRDHTMFKSGYTWAEIADGAEAGTLTEEQKEKFYAWLSEACEAHTRKEGVPSRCWVYHVNEKYPKVAITRRGVVRKMQLHRLVCEVKYGKLGCQDSHHVCGDPRCVNPDHVVPATQAANVAESLARNSYIRRVRELEAWIRLADPKAEILKRAAFGKPVPDVEVPVKHAEPRPATTPRPESPVFSAVYEVDPVKKAVALTCTEAEIRSAAEATAAIVEARK